ncbi:PAS domain S-box protein [Oscillatoria sp. FACHB-1407]|uniref:PAS domain S-box protein n=1 Tax=Oscillatoria sp. FACHB-1407 TaxID=2692847 RepID=UPI00168999A2|nr:PAS domain S-box protein [Oscillatoria sp. FACHB-1407]MBD2463466.1 PAS domain S-box protein [Oscillatoria sp. FACHB-1407]
MRQRHQYQRVPWLKAKLQSYWMPLLLGIVATVAVFGLWQQLLVREQLHIEQLVRQEVTAIESELNRELSVRVLALERMASRWRAIGGTPRSLWEVDAANYVEHSSGYQAIEWVDPSFYVRWVVPLKGNEAALNLSLDQEPRRRITLSIARDLRQTILTKTVSLPHGGKGFLAVVPLFVEDHTSPQASDRFEGFIVGVFRFQSLFDSLLHTLPEYQVQIYDRNRLIYSQGTPSPGAQPKTGVVQTYSADWQVQVFPTSTLIAQERSPLPNLILGSGLLSAWAMALVMYLGQRAERSNEQARKMNQQLHQEIAERQQTEMELRRSEASNRHLSDRLNLAVQSAQIGIWDWDIINDSLIWDDQMYRLYGLNPFDFSGTYEAWESALHPDDLEKTTTIFWRAVRGEEDYKPEFRVVHPDGTIRYIQAYAVVQRNGQGEAQRMIGVNFDITKHKQAEAALALSEERLSLVLKGSNEGWWDWDLITNELYYSPRWWSMIGFEFRELEDTPDLWQRLMHPDDFDGVTPFFQQQLANGSESYEVEFRLHHKQGHYVPVISRGYISRDQDGTPIRVSGTNIDLSDRKQAEQALENAQARFFGILEIASDAIISVDAHQHITLFNKGAEHIFGYSSEEVLGQPLSLLMPDRFAHVHHQHVDQYAQTGNTRQMAERGAIFGRRKDGSEFPAEASISKLTLNGEAIFTTFLRDITERQQSETAMARLAAIVESSEDAIVGKSLDGIITSWNAGAERIFGYTAEEMVGQPLTTLIPEGYLNEESQILARIRRGERIKHYDTKRLTKGGTLIDLSINISPIKDAQGNIIGASKIARDISERVRLDAERKQTEIALRQSEEKFRMAIDFTYNWEYWQSPDGAFIYISPSCERITGYTPAEFIADPSLLHAIVHPGDRSILNRHFCHNAITADHIDYRIITKTGETCWISHICQPVFNSTGQFLGTRASNRDISEQKQAELALQESEARFQAFMNHSPTAAWITDADGIMLYVSQTYLHIFQLLTTDLIGKSVFELYPNEVADQLLQNIQTVARTQQVLEAIEVAPRRDGTMGKFLVYKFPIPDSSGQLLVGGVAIDVTQQHQAEEELRHQKEMFQVIVDNIPVMIALFNDQGRIDFINPEFERTLGWSLQEWQQRDVMVDLYPDPVYLRGVLDHMTAAMGNWKDFTTLTATKQQIETSWTNVPISKGRFLGIGQDISDRKRKELVLQQAMEAAEAANLAKSVFLANMSHELRTPLNVILGFAQVMAHDTTLTPAQQEDLQTIRRSGDYLLNLINDVLDLSKIEAGHFSLEESGFDFISLLHMLRTMMAERAQAKHLQLTFDIAPEVPQFVIADEQKIRQVLLNLLSNAIKFTKQGSVTLRVTSHESQDSVCSPRNTQQCERSSEDLAFSPAYTLQFEVIDTGVGIAATEQNTIFDAFVQAEAGRKSFTGTGLGLTISRKLLELMNGTISVRSIPNVGSTFTVTVPVCPTSGVEVCSEQRDRTVIGLVPGQSHRRILVVDDQPENRQLMVRLLTQIGLEVREATNGQEAIALWQTWQPDLTWMDIRMPGVDGYEATKQIRAMEHGQASIIIALTAQASQSDRTLALAAGCNDYISKPFREETLFLKLKEYLGLEYLYAESETPPRSPSIASPNPNADHLPSFDPMLLAQLPASWLGTLEDLALCGNDRAIVDLANQLAAEFEALRSQLVDLANQFEFEQIVHLIHRNASP